MNCGQCLQMAKQPPWCSVEYWPSYRLDFCRLDPEHPIVTALRLRLALAARTEGEARAAMQAPAAGGDLEPAPSQRRLW